VSHQEKYKEAARITLTQLINLVRVQNEVVVLRIRLKLKQIYAKLTGANLDLGYATNNIISIVLDL
jgi:hypothetical protein